MFVGVGRLDLRIFESGSLKAKRHVVKGLLAGLRSTYQVAAAEVDHQDLWQRATLGVACVSESTHHARRVLHEVERHVRSDHRVEVLQVDAEIVGLEE